MTEERAVLVACAVERRLERASRKGKEFSDRAFWSAYVSAVMDRRAAVDEWMKNNPDEEPEVESMEMFG